MFELYLKSRPYDFGLDYKKLAQLTENYVSADLEMIVNDASRIALRQKSRITMAILENVINKIMPFFTQYYSVKWENYPVHDHYVSNPIRIDVKR